jgi:light-regulated signal transduction histidine kinase (bacteriophytochrome)
MDLPVRMGFGGRGNVQDVRELTVDEPTSHQGVRGNSTTAPEESDDVRRRTERKLREQAAEIEILKEELNSFSYSVSHDLRAPIRHIQGFAGIVLEDYGSQVPAELRQYLERINEGASDLHRMVEGLLEVARITQQPMELQSTDLGQLVREIIDGVVQTTPARHPTEWRVQTLPNVECDTGMVKILMEQLILNAFQFTRPKARGVVTIGAENTNDEVRFFVKDNGIGFDPKYADKLFGVFQRLHADQGFDGLGLGLAAAERIVRRHGGRIWYDAAPGEGACFYFTLAAQG